MNGIPFTKSEIKNFVKLYKEGESTRSIAKKFNVYHSNILWHFDKLGLKRRGRKEAAKLGVIKGRIKIFRHKIPKSARQISLEKSYILGVLCGDGCLHYNEEKNRYQIALSVTNKEFFNEFRNCLFKVYKIQPTNEYLISKNENWRNKYVTRLCSKSACEDLLEYCKFGILEWKIPEIIKKSNLRIQSAFLKGFYDSEGDVDKNYKRVGLTSINQKGLYEIKELLENFNIRSTIISTNKVKGNRRTRYTLRIQDRKSVEKFHKFINFTIIYKKENLEKIINNYKIWVTPRLETIKLRPLMIKYRNEGLSYGEIGKKLNIGMVTVWNHLNKLDNFK